MKKVAKFLVLALVLFIPFMVNVHAEEKKTEEKSKVNVYLFRGDGCPHCAEAEEWFDGLAKDEEFSKYYELVDYEVWYNEENAKFMDEVAKALNTEASGVPFIVVGKKYFSGFSSEMSDEIKTAIKDAYNDKDYKDVVKATKKGEKNIVKKEKSPFVPIIIVSVVALITVIALVFFTKEK
ncbi:MAG: hypothetical protein J6O56_03405 [Bacilli bacterium]|nr:hypothetical protein [Bacilli bacterium]